MPGRDCSRRHHRFSCREGTIGSWQTWASAVTRCCRLAIRTKGSITIPILKPSQDVLFHTGALRQYTSPLAMYGRRRCCISNVAIPILTLIMRLLDFTAIHRNLRCMNLVIYTSFLVQYGHQRGIYLIMVIRWAWSSCAMHKMNE